MLYRENGQFKTSYRADQQVFPILQDRVAHRAAAGLRLRRRAAAGERLPVPRHPDPLPDPLAGRAGPEHPGGLLRPDLAGHGRLHGGGRLCGAYNFFVRIAGHAADPGAAARRRCAPPPSACCSALPSLRVKGLYLAVATLAAQFFADWMFLRIKWFTTTRPPARWRCRTCSVFGLPIESARQQVPVLPGRAGRVRADGQEPGAQRHRPRMDGDPRHGRGRRGDRHPPDVRQAHAPSPSAPSSSAWRARCGPSSPGRLGALGLLRRPFVPAAVHGDHRRAGLDHGQLLRRRPSSWCCRSLLNQFLPVLAGLFGIDDLDGRHRACRADDLRRPDRVVPDRGAARAGAALVHRPSRSCGCGPSRIDFALPTALRRSACTTRRPMSKETLNETRQFHASAAAACMACARRAVAQAKEQFIPVLSYRTGAFAPNGAPWANGYVDYMKLVNARGGINGVKTQLRGMRDRLRHRPQRRVLRAPEGQARWRSFVQPLSTGATFAHHREGAGRQDPGGDHRLRPQRERRRHGVQVELPDRRHLLGGRRRDPAGHRQEGRRPGQAQGQEARAGLPRQPLRQGTDPAAAGARQDARLRAAAAAGDLRPASSRRRPGCRSARTGPTTCCCGAGA